MIISSRKLKRCNEMMKMSTKSTKFTCQSFKLFLQGENLENGCYRDTWQNLTMLIKGKNLHGISTNIRSVMWLKINIFYANDTLSHVSVVSLEWIIVLKTFSCIKKALSFYLKTLFSLSRELINSFVMFMRNLCSHKKLFR